MVATHRGTNTFFRLGFGLLDVATRVFEQSGRARLTLVRCIKEGGNTVPSLVGLRCELLHICLPDLVGLLFLDRGGVGACVSEPLMPLS